MVFRYNSESIVYVDLQIPLVFIIGKSKLSAPILRIDSCSGGGAFLSVSRYCGEEFWGTEIKNKYILIVRMSDTAQQLVSEVRVPMHQVHHECKQELANTLTGYDLSL